MPRPGDVIDERFEIAGIAGAGGMGTVHRATDRSTGQTVAVKVITNPRDALRFVREAEALRELAHPGIVGYVAHGSADGAAYLAMEWLEGEDLQQRLEREGLTISESLTIALRAASALGAAHARNVVHRDIKPSNLFLLGGSPAHVKVLDFGVARMGAAALTHTGAVVGTPGYVSPEQARGLRTIDARADVFALGCVLFECLTGRPAFVGDHPIALLAKILLEDSPRVSELCVDVPSAIDELVARAMAKEAIQRPADGAAFARELEALCADGAIFLSGRPQVREQTAKDALTVSEQRVVSVIVIRGEGQGPSVDDPFGETAVDMRPLPQLDAIRKTADIHAARMEALADGSLLAILSGSAAATDTAARSARCALAMRALAPSARIGLSTGRADASSRIPLGDVLTSAVRRAAIEGVPIDDLTAGLLDARFLVHGDARGFLLLAEREPVSRARTLLGRSTPCMGREREIGTLAAIFEGTALDGVASCVLVTGPAGIGKSRVREELVRRLGDRDIALWIASGDSIRRGAPFGMIAHPLRQEIRDGDSLDVRRRKLAARVARHVPESEQLRVTTFLGELIGTPSERASPELAAARADGIVMGDQMRRAWQDFLGAETRAHPVLMILEDLHWGDLPSVSLIDMALRNLRDRPWMVLALARPEVTDVFPQLWSERGLQHVKLDDLTPQACQKIVRAVLPQATPATVDSIVEHAAGNPFYLEELVRARAQNGSDSSLPTTLLAMVQSRLEGMHVELRRILRAASIFGNVFWADAVRALVGEGFDEEHLADLERREVIERAGEGRFPAHADFRFRHAVVREAAYAMLTEADTQLGHRLAADWLERAGEIDAVALAEHWERGGENERSIPWYLRAASQAHDGNDFDSVIQRANRGIALAPDGPAVGAFRLLQAEAHRWRADNDQAAACAVEALALAPVGSLEWLKAQGVLFHATATMGKPEIASAAIDAILAAENSLVPSDADTWVMMYTRGAGCSSLMGDHDRARKCAAAAERVFARGDGSLIAEGWVTHARTVNAAIEGDMATVAIAHENAGLLLERAGDSRNAALELTNAGDARKEIGDYATAESQLRRALASGERMGLTIVTAMCKTNLAVVIGRQGKLDSGIKLLRACIEDAQRLRHPRNEGYTRAYLSSLLFRAGDLHRAEEEARHAVDLLDAAHSAALPQAQAMLAKTELALGKLDAAKIHARAAMDARAIEEGEALVRLTWVEVLLATGDREGARSALEAARQRLLERASKITDASLRQCFLEGVEENARTFADLTRSA